MEHKQVEALVTGIDETKGEVTAIFSVFGNIDSYKDRIFPGAFSKTFMERGQKVAVLDNHSTASTGDVVGKTISLRELKREELPPELMARFPMSTGAAEIVAKFEPDPAKDARSAAAFYRLKNGWVNDWSFGYDAKDYDYSDEVLDGKNESIRNLRTIKLYEVSPVIFPANEATMTTGVKNKPTEGKPYGAVRRGGKWQVYKLDEDGNPTGDSLGEHDSEDEANAQVRALYANEGKAVTRTEGDGQHPAGHYLVVEDNVYDGPWKQEAIRKLTALYNAEDLPLPGKSDGKETEVKVGRILARRNADRINQVISLLQEIMSELQPDDEPDEEMPMDEEGCKPKKPTKADTGPQGLASSTSSDEAGTSDQLAPDLYLNLIEIEQQKLKLLEV